MKKHVSAFTLIELLVVLGIIGILAAILMPALVQARNKAKTIKCVSRQKQAATSFVLYANDYNGFAYGGPEWGAVMLPENFVQPYRDAGKLVWENAPLGQGYLREEEILFCPAEKLSNLFGAESYCSSLTSSLKKDPPTPFRFTTIGTVKNPDQDSPPLPIPFRLYISPSSSVLGGDSAIIAPISGNKYTYFSGITNNATGSNRFCHIDMRHNKNANVFMADGHVKNVGKDLADCYFYNVRNSIHKDEKFTVAIKNQEKFSLEE